MERNNTNSKVKGEKTEVLKEYVAGILKENQGKINQNQELFESNDNLLKEHRDMSKSIGEAMAVLRQNTEAFGQMFQSSLLLSQAMDDFRKRQIETWSGIEPDLKPAAPLLATFELPDVDAYVRVRQQAPQVQQVPPMKKNDANNFKPKSSGGYLYPPKEFCRQPYGPDGKPIQGRQQQQQQQQQNGGGGDSMEFMSGRGAGSPIPPKKNVNEANKTPKSSSPRPQQQQPAEKQVVVDLDSVDAPTSPPAKKVDLPKKNDLPPRYHANTSALPKPVEPAPYYKPTTINKVRQMSMEDLKKSYEMLAARVQYDREMREWKAAVLVEVIKAAARDDERHSIMLANGDY